MGVRHGHLVAAHFGSVATETAVCLRSVGLADRFGQPAGDRPAGTIALGLIGPRAPAALEAARLDRAPFPAFARPQPDGYDVVVAVGDGPAAWLHLLHASAA